MLIALCNFSTPVFKQVSTRTRLLQQGHGRPSCLHAISISRALKSSVVAVLISTPIFSFPHWRRRSNFLFTFILDRVRTPSHSMLIPPNSVPLECLVSPTSEQDLKAPYAELRARIRKDLQNWNQCVQEEERRSGTSTNQ